VPPHQAAHAPPPPPAPFLSHGARGGDAIRAKGGKFGEGRWRAAEDFAAIVRENPAHAQGIRRAVDDPQQKPYNARRGVATRSGARARAVDERDDGSILFLHLLMYTEDSCADVAAKRQGSTVRCTCPKEGDEAEEAQPRQGRRTIAAPSSPSKSTAGRFGSSLQREGEEGRRSASRPRLQSLQRLISLDNSREGNLLLLDR